MYWILFTLLAIGLRALFSIASKNLTNAVQVSAGTQNFLLTGAAALLSLPLSPWLGRISFTGTSHVWPAILIMITCASLGGVTFFEGQRHLDASTAQIAFSSILLWGVVLSIIFLGSHFSAVQLVGVVILLVAIIMTQYRKTKRKLDAGIVWILISAALFAGFQVASAELAKSLTAAIYLFLSFGGPTVFVGVFYSRSIIEELPKLAVHASHNAKPVLLAALASLGYYIFSYLAYHHAPDPGAVVVLLTIQVVLSVLLGIVFLHEREGVKRKLLAGVLAFIAGALIKAG